jgi:hypothetical protein
MLTISTAYFIYLKRVYIDAVIIGILVEGKRGEWDAFTTLEEPLLSHLWLLSSKFRVIGKIINQKPKKQGGIIGSHPGLN